MNFGGRPEARRHRRQEMLPATLFQLFVLVAALGRAMPALRNRSDHAQATARGSVQKRVFAGSERTRAGVRVDHERVVNPPAGAPRGPTMTSPTAGVSPGWPDHSGSKTGGRGAGQQGRRSDDGRQCGNAWSGFENKSKEVGEDEEVHGEILAHQEEQGLPKELHEDGGQEVFSSGYGASKNVESSCSGTGSNRKI